MGALTGMNLGTLCLSVSISEGQLVSSLSQRVSSTSAATKVPLPCWRRTRPSFSKSSTAWRTVTRATPNSSCKSSMVEIF